MILKILFFQWKLRQKQNEVSVRRDLREYILQSMIQSQLLLQLKVVWEIMGVTWTLSILRMNFYCCNFFPCLSPDHVIFDNLFLGGSYPLALRCFCFLLLFLLSD